MIWIFLAGGRVDGIECTLRGPRGPKKPLCLLQKSGLGFCGQFWPPAVATFQALARLRLSQTSVCSKPLDPWWWGNPKIDKMSKPHESSSCSVGVQHQRTQLFPFFEMLSAIDSNWLHLISRSEAACFGGKSKKLLQTLSDQQKIQSVLNKSNCIEEIYQPSSNVGWVHLITVNYSEAAFI